MMASVWNKIGLRTLLCGGLGFAGVAGFMTMAAHRTPPESAVPKVRPLSSRAIRATPGSVQTLLTGFGEIHAWRQTEIGAEVSGRIVEIHPELRSGGRIRAGETLFAIDPSDFASRVAELEAEAALAANASARIAVEQDAERERLALAQRNLELADAHRDRTRTLFESNRVGSLATVEAAERERNTLAEQVRALRANVDLHPIGASDAARRAETVAAMLDRARHDLARCRVTAPYDARIARSSVETEQWVSPGSPLLTLVDDSVREILVALEATVARDRLRFESGSASANGWFGRPEPVPCRIFWSDAPSAAPAATGSLHRVVQIDRETRMVTVAIRLENHAAPEWPVADGMFCRVEIPGRVIPGVFALPRHALNRRGQVYRAVQGFLEATPVRTVHTDRETVYVDQGLRDGDLVLVSRLVNPLDHSPVAIEEILP